MSEFTPTPWQIYDDVDPHNIKIKGIRPDIGGAHVADVLFPANAAFIIKACNSHDTLVNALQNARGYIDSVIANSPDKKKRRNFGGCLRIIDDALASIKETSK